MRVVSALLLITAGVLLAFFIWGYFTASGQNKFDEMDGMYPLIAGVIGAVLAVIGVALILMRLKVNQ